MSHHVYHTRAFVMRSYAHGEADTALELFTEDFGRITVHARGLRREASRLRYILQPMSWASVNVVRGAGGWRLTTANPSDMLTPQTKERPSLSRVTRVVQKFFPHEVASVPVFQGLLFHTTMLSKDPARSMDWEVVTLARLFLHLGYWSINLEEDLLQGSELVPNLSTKTREAFVREINRILRTVHT